MQTYHFDKIVNNEGGVTLSGLPPLEKVAVVVMTPEAFDDDSIGKAWAAEVERRIAEVENGDVQVLPMDDALAQVRSALK